DYTKWHIGIYLSVAGGLTAAVGYIAEKKADALAPYVSSPKVLFASIIAMFLAGICGGVVASSCTGCTTYEELWHERQGPFGLKFLLGRYWAGLEHFFFWLSAILSMGAVLSSTAVVGWLMK